ncbi:MAG: type 4a pilus biogenesis protein PilO [Candidatus Pacebacteria bacterium]|nr:type 4a pilus biogenesis protein PilO [Candidatus Paceibacterota bacterium]
MFKTLTPIILLIASIGLFFGFIDPQYKQIQAKRAKLAQYDEALGKSKDLTNRRIELSEKYKSITDDDRVRLSKMLPNAVDNVRLILDIDSIAKLHGMKIRNTKIDQGPSLDEKNNPLIVDERKYGSIGLGFSVTSSYSNFINFLDDLEHSLRITDIVSLSLRPQKVGVYDFAIDLKTYWLKAK